MLYHLRRRFMFGLVALGALLCSGVAAAEDWTQFRGSSAGKIDGIEHPLEWAGDKNIAWAVPMKGTGWSSPVVVGDRVFMTSAEPANGQRPKGMMAGVGSMMTYRSAKPVKHQFVVTCRNLLDGKTLWRKSLGEQTPPVVHPSNTYATESPATDGTRVFTFFATTGQLVAWDLDGKELWRQDLGTYKSGNGFGTGSSLAVADGRVFVQSDNDEKSFVVAYQAVDGKQVWRAERKTKTSWSSPLLWQYDGKSELVTCGGGTVTSYRPQDGTVLWRLNGIKSGFSASPAVDAERQQIFFGNSGPGSAGPLVSVKAGLKGEIQLDSKFESEQVAWSRTKSGPGMASPLVSQGRLYIPGSRGILSCYDVASGEQVYRTRVPKMGTVAASLWGDNEHIFILDENGTTFVLEAGAEFKLKGTNTLKDLFWSTPAIAGNRLLLRGVEKLYCIRK